MVEIWLIRHGESEANAGLETKDAASSPLTELGKRQAEAVSNCIPPSTRMIVSSRFTRARESALILRSKVPNCSVVEWPVHEYTFLPSIAYRGTREADRQDAVHDYWKRLDPRLRVGKGAESYKRFIGRVGEVRDLLRQQPEGPVAIVSHRRFIAGLLWTCLKNDFRISSRRMEKFHSFDKALAIRNGAIVPLFVEHGRALIGAIKTDHLDVLPNVTQAR